MEDRRFHDRFEKANTRVADKLRKKIKDDIDQRKFDEGKPLCFMVFHSYTALLIPLDRYPEEFRQLYSDAVFDLDMKDDLERSKVINWCRTIKPLNPVKTTADGNCLMNAVSQAMWGIEDTDGFLRRLLYVTMTTDPNGRFKRRWVSQQRAVIEEAALDLRMNTDQYNTEWDTVIRATTDICNTEDRGLPYSFLESIHLCIIANILKRPVILLADSRARNLLGESMQENDIGGIYLPLEWNHRECQKNPIVLGYNMNHFAPLIGQECVKSDSGATTQACSLVNHELQHLKIHFLLPDEESHVTKLLSDYLKVEEVEHALADGVVKIPCSRLTYNTLSDDLNMIQEHRKDSERKFRNQVDEEAGHRPALVQPKITDRTTPFIFQTSTLNDRNLKRQSVCKPESVKLVQPMQIAAVNLERMKHCSVVGCKMYGSPEFNGLCSKCFHDFTVQYAEDEAASRKRKTIKQTIKPPAVNPAPIYNDLSIMGENCQTGCGFRCSTETYPYCHECYPKFAETRPVAEIGPLAEHVDFSLMPDKCREPNCLYNASKQTFPYCHQCCEKHVPKVQPSAPQVSIPKGNMETDPQVTEVGNEENLLLRIEKEPETNVVEIRQPAEPCSYLGLFPKTGGSNDVPKDTLLAEGSGILDRKCKTGGCLNSAIKGNDGFCDQCYDHSLFGDGIASKCRTAGCNAKTANSYFPCDLCLECFLKVGTLPSRSDLQATPFEGKNEKSKPEPRVFVAVEEANLTAFVETVNNKQLPKQEASLDERNKMHRKYICAKAGCEGIRIDKITGLCYDCCKAGNLKTEIRHQASNEKSNLNDSIPFISDTPFLLSEEEKKEKYPIVTSSKQKVKCAAAVCNNMIYPPSKLCEECTAIIEKSHAEKLKSGKTGHTAPINSTKSRENAMLQRHTVPITKQPSKLCIEKDCDRFGDPAQKDRCSKHYNLAIQRFRQPSPTAEVAPFNYNRPANKITERTFPQNVSVSRVPTENGDKLTAAMCRIENTRKSKAKCKNFERSGCSNWANPTKRGFCNQCFDNLSAQTLLGHPELHGRNQFD